MRALVIEDSPLYRQVMQKVLSSFGVIDSITFASSGGEGLARVRERDHDVLFLDLHLPDMNGRQILEQTRRIAPSLDVVIVSSHGGAGTDLTLECLRMGALEFIVKPSRESVKEAARALQQMIAVVLKTLHFRREDRGRLDAVPARPARPATSGPALTADFRVTAISTSTGGPQALASLIPRLPEDYPHPILIAQHMPPRFTESLARSLDERSALSVAEAVDGEVALAGHVYIAPGGRHLKAEWRHGDLWLHVVDQPADSLVKPSADLLLSSLAGGDGHRRSVLAVVLTGMGEDGRRGMQVLKEAGSCFCLAQSGETCVVNGMPAAVIDSDLADEIVHLPDLAGRLIKLACAPVRT